MVKPGYKQTEIGVIPEDWEVKSLNEIAPLQRGFDLPYSQMEEGKYPVVFSNGVGAFHNAYMAKGPGVITGRSGTIGKVHYISTNYWPHNTTLWVTDFHGNDEKYVYYLFQTVPWELFNSRSSVPTLNRNDVHDTLHAIPPRPEQRRIAEALSDMDELIASLEKLIAKKKAIKQGAMQELLTGKRRLPGFSGEWRETPIKSIGEVITGSTPSRSRPEYWDGKHAWVSARDFNFKYIANTAETVSDTGKKECRFVPKGSILVTCIASIGLNAIAACECATNQQINSVICNPDYDNEFVYYQICAQTSVMKAIAGQTAVPIVSKKQFEDLRIAVPPSLQEQQEIGRTLANIDSELLSFRMQLTKVREIKQGMMQQLLTGKIRLQSEV